MGLSLPIKDHLNELMRKVAESYLDGNLAVKANAVSLKQDADASDADDEDENFEKSQRTQKSEDLDNFSRLMRL